MNKKSKCNGKHLTYTSNKNFCKAVHFEVLLLYLVKIQLLFPRRYGFIVTIQTPTGSKDAIDASFLRNATILYYYVVVVKKAKYSVLIMRNSPKIVKNTILSVAQNLQNHPMYAMDAKKRIIAASQSESTTQRRHNTNTKKLLLQQGLESI